MTIEAGQQLLHYRLIEGGRQDLVLLERAGEGFRQSVICEVLYVPLQGEYAPAGE